ncbi:MAG TPA: AGE family epimerase/isomerase [Xanthobacteraceae bacterium]|jgi:mannose/cellobiose epimerase-like protein (N-acyl-D-glucosamine 2-epimerase family)/glycosyltransferase involved in cell wall biosynthesis
MRHALSEATALRRWLFDEALPRWWKDGADRVGGGFHEAIGLDGTPLARPHRARVIARQAFAYSEAGRLGWDGPWREAMGQALDYLHKHFVGADATVVSVVDLDGRVRDPSFDLYNQAFALLAYASGHAAFGEQGGWRQRAVALRATLERCYAHPQGGFAEDLGKRLPRRSNPHMHLLESALAWTALDQNDPAWQRMADGLAVLASEKFIDAASGALREFFGEDWSPAPGPDGQICEPGHHYEWAFLLERWARLSGRPAPDAAARLVAFADRYGLDARRGVAINAVLADGRVHDPTARLWAQAERIRAYVAHRRADEEIAAAIAGLRRFLAAPVPGLWLDQLTADDTLVSEPARATSLYHIVGAVAELSAAIPESTARARAPSGRSERAAPRVIYLVTEDWYFISHRLPMARAARMAGFEVHVATRVNRHRAAIEAEGFHLHPITWRRGSFDPRDLVRVVREVRKLYRAIKPDLAHHVALPAAVVGSLAATGLDVVCLNAMTGLGTMFISDSLKMRAGRMVLALGLSPLLNRARSAVLVQNLDDRAAIEQLGVAGARIALIPGSGVDTDALTPKPEPQGPVTVAFVGRLVGSKGMRALLAAHERLRQRGRDISLLIAGVPDPANPTSIPPHEIEGWSRRPNLTYLGFVEDIAGLWARAHIAVLPSHREGMPLSLLEAAACGRPLVATDVPGCRDIARSGVNALLVPIDDAEALADAIEHLALNPELRCKFGAASRRLAEEQFSSKLIGRELVDLYRRLLARAA